MSINFYTIKASVMSNTLYIKLNNPNIWWILPKIDTKAIDNIFLLKSPLQKKWQIFLFFNLEVQTLIMYNNKY